MSHHTHFPHSLDDDGIAELTLPESAATCDDVCPEPLSALVATLESLAARDDVKALLLHQSSTAKWLPATSAEGWLQLCDRREAVQIANDLQERTQLLRRVERLGKPVAIVLAGDCLDLELEFAMACQFRVSAGDATRQRFGFPLVMRGLPPSAGATQRLPRLAGIAAALPLLLKGSQLNALAAQEMGLVHAIAPLTEARLIARQRLLEQPDAQAAWDLKGYRIPGGAGAMAAQATRLFSDNIAALRKDSNDTQPSPMSTLSAVYEGTLLPMDAALRVEVQCAAQTFANPATANQIRSQWLHQDQARSLIRKPSGFAAQPVKRLGVLGAGLMGAGIAQVAAAAGIDVVMVDTNAEHVQSAREKIAASLARSHGEKSTQIVARIDATANLSKLHGCDFVIEAVFENREVKADLMARAALALGERSPHFVWASNTSTLPISGLAAHWAEPEQVIGMHFFSPVPRMPLLEIITGEQTSQATLARSMELAALLGKTPILVNDSPGFYTSRIFCAYIDEGMAMLAEGVLPALIENAARQAGFATSPLAVTDEVGLDLQDLVISQATKDGLAEKFLRLQAKPVVDRMNQLKRLGRKSGGGFYDYPQGGSKHLWSGLGELFPQNKEQPPVEQVRTRLLSMQAMESARCLEEGVLTSAADGDIGSLLGLGYPAWTGGTLSYIDTIGCAQFVLTCDALADQFGERFRPSNSLRERAKRNERFHGR